LKKRIIGAGLRSEGTVWGSAASRAEATVRTELARAYDTAMKSHFATTSWIIGYQHMTIPEGPWPCSICAPLHGVFYPKGTEPSAIQHPNCYDNETMVLTRRGWLYVSEVEIGDLCFSIDPENRENVDWVKVISTCDYDAPRTLQFSHKWADLVVTPNHNMVVCKKSDSPLSFMSAEKFASMKCGVIPTTSNWVGKDQEEIFFGGKTWPSELLMRFLGWYISEGSCTETYHKSGSQRHQISIAQKDTMAVAKEISGAPYNMHVGKQAITIHNKLLANDLAPLGKSANKRVPEFLYELCPRLLRIFLETFAKGDGNIRKPKPWKGISFSDEVMLFTSSRILAGELCAIAVKAGYAPSITIDRVAGNMHKFSNGTYIIKNDIWRIRLGKRKGINRNTLSVTEYGERHMYGIELEKFNTLYVSRHGRCCWSGNCRCYHLPVTEMYGTYDI
jgi:hypothetical protein